MTGVGAFGKSYITDLSAVAGTCVLHERCVRPAYSPGSGSYPLPLLQAVVFSGRPGFPNICQYSSMTTWNSTLCENYALIVEVFVSHASGPAARPPRAKPRTSESGAAGNPPRPAGRPVNRIWRSAARPIAPEV